MIKIEDIISGLQWANIGDIFVPDHYCNYQSQSVYNSPYRSIKPSLSYSDLTNEKLPLNKVIERIQELSKNNWLSFVSVISLGISKKGLSDHKLQCFLANDFSVGPYQKEIVLRVTKGGYYLFIPITLASLAKLAIAHAPDEGNEIHSDDLISFITTTYLALNDHVNNNIKKLCDLDSETALKRFFIQNQYFGTTHSLFETTTRIWNLLYKYPELIKSPIIPNEIFKLNRGIDIELFLAVAQFIFTYNFQIDFSTNTSIRQYLYINPKPLFKKTKLSEEQLNSFFKYLIFDKENTENVKNQNPESNSYFFDFYEFRQHPLYRVTENIYMPIFYPFFIERVTEILYWEIFDYMKNHEGYDHRKFATEFGFYLEHYVQDKFEYAFRDHNILAKRYWIEPKDHHNAPSADVVIAYPNAFVFIEVKAARFKYEKTLVLGEVEAIEDDLRQMLYEPVQQLAEAIDYFKKGNLESQGLKWQGEKIYPIVVTYGSLPMAELIAPILKQKVREKKLMQEDYLHRLINIDVEEAMCLASLVKNNVSIIEVIDKKNTKEQKDIPFKNFVLQEYGKKAESIQILSEELKNLSQNIKKRLST